MNISVNVHSSIKLSGDKVIYFDPFKIDEKLNDADYIFITHDHYDHYDIASIENVRKSTTKFIVPAYFKDVMNEDMLLVEPSKYYELDDIKINTLPAYNINKDFHPREKGNVGYNIEVNGTRYYVLGDTDIVDEIKDVKTDICFIPIGGKFTCSFLEAAKYINEIKPKKVIPTHYGLIVGDITLGDEFKKLIDKDIEVNIKIKEN